MLTRFGILGFGMAALTVAAEAPPVTFNRDVLPILQRNCQSCHRPGEIAPMPFLTYQETRPYAKAIKAAVLTRKMPPWFADPNYGRWSNARKLTGDEMRTLARWADSGAVEGDPSDRPAPIEWPRDWQIPPELIVRMPRPFRVPARGTVEITSFTLPTALTKDTWITSIEVRPGNRRVVHHVAVFFTPHDPKVRYGEPESLAIPRDENGDQLEKLTKTDVKRQSLLGSFDRLEAVFLPGTPPMDFRAFGAGKLIPAGYDLVLQVHYTTIGEEAEDQTEVGFTFARGQPSRRFVTLSPTPPRDAEAFHIPAGDGNWEVSTEVEFDADANLVWFLPHMHLRGKDMTYELELPDGGKRIALRVPNYDFNWQLAYEAQEPIRVTKGTKLLATAHFDNSVNNGLNPNPNKDVWWGDQTWEEMMVAWFGVVVDKNADPNKVIRYTRLRSAAARNR